MCDSLLVEASRMQETFLPFLRFGSTLLPSILLFNLSFNHSLLLIFFKLRLNHGVWALLTAYLTTYLTTHLIKINPLIILASPPILLRLLLEIVCLSLCHIRGPPPIILEVRINDTILVIGSAHFELVTWLLDRRDVVGQVSLEWTINFGALSHLWLRCILLLSCPWLVFLNHLGLLRWPRIGLLLNDSVLDRWVIVAHHLIIIRQRFVVLGRHWHLSENILRAQLNLKLRMVQVLNAIVVVGDVNGLGPWKWQVYFENLLLVLSIVDQVRHFVILLFMNLIDHGPSHLITRQCKLFRAVEHALILSSLGALSHVSHD